MTNPLEEIARAVRGRGRLLIVDAISSLSSIPLDTDGWGLDVVVSGSQKGWMVAPGLALVSVSERAWEAQERCTAPRMYLDLRRARDSLAAGQTPWTPAVSLMFQLRRALALLREEGVEAVWERHRATAGAVRDGVRELGFGLFADEGARSDTVTAILPPGGVAADELRAVARSDFGTVFAGGQAGLRGRILRFGHLGRTSGEDVRGALRRAARQPREARLRRARGAGLARRRTPGAGPVAEILVADRIAEQGLARLREAAPRPRPHRPLRGRAGRGRRRGRGHRRPQPDPRHRPRDRGRAAAGRDRPRRRRRGQHRPPTRPPGAA